MLLSYHVGRFVLGSLCVGDLVRLGWSGVRVAGFSLQHGHHCNPTAPLLFLVRCVLYIWCHSNPTKPNNQHTTNQVQNDRCGNSTAQSQAPDDGYINVRNMLSA